MITEEHTFIVDDHESVRLFRIQAALLSVIFIPLCLFEWTFIPLLVFPTLLLIKKKGIEFDINNRRFRNFTSRGKFRKGKWQDWTKYFDVVLQSRSAKKNVRSGNLVPDLMGVSGKLEYRQTIHNVYIMDEKHLKKMFIDTFKSYAEAKDFAIAFSEYSNMPIRKFSPQISEASRNRR